jgi:hypothetical protein
VMAKALRAPFYRFTTSSSASCLSSGDLAVGSFDSVTACPFSQPNQRVSISGQQAVTPDF